MNRKFWLVAELECAGGDELEERLAKALEHSTAREALAEAMGAEVRLRLATLDDMNRDSAGLIREMGETIEALMDSAELSQDAIEPETAELIERIRARGFPAFAAVSSVQDSGGARVRAVVRRDSHEEVTVAVVACDQSDMVRTADDLLPRLRAALDRWRRTSMSGRRAWRESCHDFNVGDLGNWVAEPALIERLAVEGIAGLSVDIFSSDEPPRPDWTFDTVLIDEAGDKD